MQSTVSENREYYLGGSDIPVVLGISKYKTRFQLLKEKAKLVPVAPVFVNQAITYGNTMEPKIRDYLNEDRDPCDKFNEWKFERPFKDSDLRARGHLDGYDATNKIVLEIKTTGEFRGDDLRDYPEYLFQMLFYMEMPRPKLKGGVLAIYLRPEDYNEVFDPTRLKVFTFTRDQVKAEIKRLNNEIDMFLADLQFIESNPEKSEIELINKEVATTAAKALAFEKKIAELKKAEDEYKTLKEELVKQMETYGVPTFEAGGYQITLVAGTADSVDKVKTCDFDTLELFFPDAAEACVTTEEKKKSGHKASVRITKKKGAAS